MNSPEYNSKIRKALGWFVSHVKIENVGGHFDINKDAEGFLISILNPIFKKEFIRLEYIEVNYPAVDVASTDNDICIQITSEKGYDKIKTTIDAHISNPRGKGFKQLYFLIIDVTYKPSKTDADIKALIRSLNSNMTFELDKHFINIGKLGRLIEEKCNIDELKKIADYLDKQGYGSGSSLPLFDDIIVPYADFFDKELSEDGQFRNPFIERMEYLDEIDSFVKTPTLSVLPIVADGGYGKTRLCIEYFKKHIDNSGEYEACVLNEEAFHCLDFSEQIRSNKKIVVLFDDAHKRPEILNDVVRVVNRLPNVKLLITIRRALYDETIIKIATHCRPSGRLEVDRLSHDETKKLFKIQLPDLREQDCIRLAEKTKGVPLVCLALCKNITNGKEVSEDESFLLSVKEHKNQIIQDIYSEHYINQTDTNNVIELLSFLSPLKNTEQEIAAFAKISTLAIDRVEEILNYLDECGFVKKTIPYPHINVMYQITPDLYSDAVLQSSIQRVNSLLKNTSVAIFSDRLIRNLMEAETSDNKIDIKGILSNFISEFKNRNLATNEERVRLKDNLTTLKYFAYKKPDICFKALKSLIENQIENNSFWKKEEMGIFETVAYTEIHNEIVAIFPIIGLNLHTTFEFDSLYDLLYLYCSKRDFDTKIFLEVFRYREYDFAEYYPTIHVCERQSFLMNKFKTINLSESDEQIQKIICDCCKVLLALDFPTEGFYDKYTLSFSYGSAHTQENEITKQIRLTSINILINLFTITNNQKLVSDSLHELLNVLHFMAIPKAVRNFNNFNRSAELDVIIDFLLKIKESVSTPSLSNIVYQLKRLSYSEIKAEFKGVYGNLLAHYQSTKTPKDRLKLLFVDECFSLKKNLENNLFAEIIQEYPDKNKLFVDVLDVIDEVQETSFRNISTIIHCITFSHPNMAKELLDFAIEKNRVCYDLNFLVRANYQDSNYFYATLDKLLFVNKDSVSRCLLCLLTYGRNEQTKYYNETDLIYIEKVFIENPKYLIEFMAGLIPYILINPKRTLDIVAPLINQADNLSIYGFFSTLFHNQQIIENHSDSLKYLILSKTLDMQLDAPGYIDALVFLETHYGFDMLFDFLKQKRNVWGYNLLYTNPNKSINDKETDFVKVLDWYVLQDESLCEKRQLVGYLRPTDLFSQGLCEKFRAHIAPFFENDKQMVINYCDAINIYETQSEILISMLIDISNELCEAHPISNEELIKIFGTDFIYNCGMRSGIAGQAFPQDLEKKEVIMQILKEKTLHHSVAKILNDSLEKVSEAIKVETKEEKW